MVTRFLSDSSYPVHFFPLERYLYHFILLADLRLLNLHA